MATNRLSVVKQELGDPVINIELTNDQILYQIDKAIFILSEFKAQNEFAIIDLAVALCKRQWGFMLNKYGINFEDNTYINSQFIYEQGCMDIMDILRGEKL